MVLEQIEDALRICRASDIKPRLLLLSPAQHTELCKEVVGANLSMRMVICGEVRVEIAKHWNGRPILLDALATQDYFDRRFSFTGPLQNACGR